MINKITKKFTIIGLLILSINHLVLGNSNSHNIIYLIGEIHNDPKCIKFKEQLKQEAISTNIILALEGIWLGQEYMYFEESINNSNIFGIEEKNAYKLTETFYLYPYILLQSLIEKYDSYKSQAKKAKNELSSSERILEMISFLVCHDYGFDSLNKGNEEVLSSLWEFIYKYDLYTGNRREKIAKIVNAYSSERPFLLSIYPHIDAWINLYKDTIDLYYDYITKENQQIIASELRYPLFKASKDMILNPFGKASDIFYNDMVNIRNHIFLKNIISIFENNKAQNKPFYVVVGVAHTPFLYKELKEKGYEVKLNDHAQEAYNQYLMESLEKADL